MEVEKKNTGSGKGLTRIILGHRREKGQVNQNEGCMKKPYGNLLLPKSIKNTD